MKMKNLPMYYRRNFTANLTNKLSVKDYIHNTADYNKYKEQHKDTEGDDMPILAVATYDFESAQEYYDSRDEFDFVGIIDQESSRKKVRRIEEIKDEFKIRNKRPKVLAKKRETGVPSFKGAVCRTSKNKKFLLKLAKKINLNTAGMTGRADICNIIRDKLFAMEKYATTNDNNKMTYLIIPVNHPIYPFPLNLEDRIKNILNNIQRETRMSINATIKPIKISTSRSASDEETINMFDDVNYIKYEIEFNETMDKFKSIMEMYGAVKKGKKWIIVVE